MSADSAGTLAEFRPRTWKAPVIFSSPHSGRGYSPQFLRQVRLGVRALRSTEDAFVDILFSDAPEFGAPLLCAVQPRAFVDLNRSPDELDPSLIADAGIGRPSRRARAGYGVIPRLAGLEQRIYRGQIKREEAELRITSFHAPYHEQLSRLMDECVVRFGEAILFDCHSAPHEVLKNSVPPGDGIPNVVFGDRYGRSCDAEISDQAEAVFTRFGFSVARNKPFPGAYVALRHGDPDRGRHVLQIELDRRLYLDENALRPGADFQRLRRLMRGVIAGLAAMRRGSLSVAAE